MERNHVFVINEGMWGLEAAADGSFNWLIRYVKNALEDTNNTGRAVTVEVVADHRKVADVGRKAEQLVYVFFTKGMSLVAKNVSKKCITSRVVLISRDVQRMDLNRAEGVVLLDRDKDLAYNRVPKLILGD